GAYPAATITPRFWPSSIYFRHFSSGSLAVLFLPVTWLIRAFSFRVHDRGFWPQPPKVVWSLLLQADSEGPTLISQTDAHLLSLSAVCCARGTLLSVYRTVET